MPSDVSFSVEKIMNSGMLKNVLINYSYKSIENAMVGRGQRENHTKIYILFHISRESTNGASLTYDFYL